MDGWMEKQKLAKSLRSVQLEPNVKIPATSQWSGDRLVINHSIAVMTVLGEVMSVSSLSPVARPGLPTGILPAIAKGVEDSEKYLEVKILFVVAPQGEPQHKQYSFLFKKASPYGMQNNHHWIGEEVAVCITFCHCGHRKFSLKGFALSRLKSKSVHRRPRQQDTATHLP